MKHYADSSGQIYAFEEDGSQDHLITSDMQPIGYEEVLERTKKEPPEPSYFTHKTDIWQRCTDDEAEQLDGQLEQAPAKQRRMWNDSITIEHSSEYFPILRDNMVEAFGEARTDEILAPSN